MNRVQKNKGSTPDTTVDLSVERGFLLLGGEKQTGKVTKGDVGN